MRGGCCSPAVAVPSSGCCALHRASCTGSQRSSRTPAKDGQQQAADWDGFPVLYFFFSSLQWINTSKLLELRLRTEEVRLVVFSFCLCRCRSCGFVSHKSTMSEGDLLESFSNRVCLFLVLSLPPCKLIFSTDDVLWRHKIYVFHKNADQFLPLSVEHLKLWGTCYQQ